MRLTPITRNTSAGTTIAALLALGLAAGALPSRASAAPAGHGVAKHAPAGRAPVRHQMAAADAMAAATPAATVTLSIGRGQLIHLSRPITDLFVAADTIADVQVRSPTMIYVFGRAAGQTTVSATDRSGVVWSATVRVGQNITSVGDMLKLAMPDAAITATAMNGLVLLTGTVATPDDVAEAQRLAQAFVGDGTQVVIRLKTATPQQVNLQVRIAEVSRDFLKSVGVNLMTRDTTGGFQFNVARGRSFGSIGPADTSTFASLDASARFGLPAGSISLPFNPKTGDFVVPGTGTKFDFSKLLAGGSTALGLAGRLFGVDVGAALDLAETDGMVTTLANPNLTALSGETASFLAGGEIPIPISQGLGAVSIEYKQYGVSLAFTPYVLADGRISMRVRPEVSQLTNAGSVTINGYSVPGLTTRRAETTIELGSGQSFMIGGLLSNTHNNTIDKAPFLGDLPVLGSLFRSNSFRRSETELVIVVTPYLVKPVDASAIRLPTDGYKGPTDAERIIGGQLFGGKSGGKRPLPSVAPPVTSGATSPVVTGDAAPEGSPPVATSDATSAPAPASGKRTATAAAAPGFSLN